MQLNDITIKLNTCTKYRKWKEIPNNENIIDPTISAVFSAGKKSRSTVRFLYTIQKEPLFNQILNVAILICSSIIAAKNVLFIFNHAFLIHDNEVPWLNLILFVAILSWY